MSESTTRLASRSRAMLAIMLAVAVSACANPAPSPTPFSPGTWLSADGQSEITLDAEGNVDYLRLQINLTDDLFLCDTSTPEFVESAGRYLFSSAEPSTLLISIPNESANTVIAVSAISRGNWGQLRWYPCAEYAPVILSKVESPT